MEWQWTLGQIINAVILAGLEVLHVGEYAEPFCGHKASVPLPGGAG